MTIGEIWNIDGPINCDLCLSALLLFTSANWSNTLITVDEALIYGSIGPSKTPSCPRLNKIPRLWTPPLGTKTHPQTWKEHLSFVSNLGSNSLELTLIPAASHLATNHPSAQWRSWPENAKRTTSICKKQRDTRTCGSQTRHPWLGFEILFMNITNWIRHNR